MSTSWRPCKQDDATYGHGVQQATHVPQPTTSIYPKTTPKTYMYSWANPSATAPTLEVPKRDAFPFKATMNPSQYVAAPDYDDENVDVPVPLIGPVPRLAKKPVHQTPPRTRGGFTPHPAAPMSLHEKSRTPYAYSEYSEYTAIPESPESLMQFEPPKTPMPWAGAGELVDGQNYFKMYDAVHVAIWSTSQNQYIWVQGVVMKPVLHVDYQGQEERYYNVTFVNPNTQQDDFQDFSPSSGHIRTAPPSEPLANSLAIWAPATGASFNSRPPPLAQEQMRIEKGTFVFSQLMVQSSKSGKNRKVWIPGVCVSLGKPLPGQPAGYWIRAVGGPTMGGEYYSEGPFKTYGARTMKELQEAGERVDVRGCERFVEK